MSFPTEPWAVAEINTTGSVEKNNTKDHDCTSSSSNSSIPLRPFKSTSDLTIIKSRNLQKKFRESPYSVESKNSGLRRKTTLNKRTGKSKHSKCNKQYTEITSESSTEDVPKECFQIKTIGNVNSQEPFACSIYVTSYNILDGNVHMHVGMEPLISRVEKITTGKIRIQQTYCGLLIAFTKEADADSVMKLPLQAIFGGPIQVARFLSGEYKFRHNIIIRDIPWCISNLEIQQALKHQGIRAGKIIRTRTHVKIEVLNALDMQRLLEEGLNFFDYTSFSAIPETIGNQGEPDIVQCFKCQGFWHTSTHCRQISRCVRCGENHDVEYCARPRSTPICCHCGGPHHAAYKMCPVRLQHINSTYLGFQIAKGKPDRYLQKNIF